MPPVKKPTPIKTPAPLEFTPEELRIMSAGLEALNQRGVQLQVSSQIINLINKIAPRLQG